MQIKLSFSLHFERFCEHDTISTQEDSNDEQQRENRFLKLQNILKRTKTQKRTENV